MLIEDLLQDDAEAGGEVAGEAEGLKWNTRGPPYPLFRDLSVHTDILVSHQRVPEGRSIRALIESPAGMRRKLGGLLLGLLVRIDEVLMDWFWDRGYGSWDEDEE